MTTIAAVKKGKKLCIASDGLAFFGTRKEKFGSQVYEEGKIIKIGPNLVGMAGHASWDLVFTDYFSKKKNIPVWKTVDEVFDLFNGMHQDLKEKYYLSPSKNLTFLQFETAEFEILIINACGIFEVEYSLVVRQYNKYSAIGTGEGYALGVMSSLYHVLEDPEEIVKIAIETAAQFDRKTELPMYTHCIEVE